MDKKEFKFTTSFSSIIKPLVSIAKDEMLAKASLLDIGKFIPNIDTSKNVDILPVAFNACVVNRMNKNGDAIDTPTAIASYKEFVNKPINIEHHRQKVIGVILTAGFSEFGTDKPLTEEEASKLTTPFNITLGGIVWRMVSPQLAELIEESNDPTSDKYESVSASWELGFSDYNIALFDPGQKNLSQAEMITDPKVIDKLKDKLKALGGDGKDNDKLVCRVPKDVLPLGIGFTEKPAAEVKGVATEPTPQVPVTQDIKAIFAQLMQDYKDGKITKEQFKEKTGCDFLEQLAASTTKEAELLNKISQLQKENVKIERKQSMKITSLKDITDDSLKQTNASEISEFISTELKKGSDVWEAEKGKLNKAMEDAKAASTKLEEDNKKTQEELKKVKDSLATLEKEKEAREKVEKFNSYMTQINEAFDLDDETRAAIVEDVKAIASDEDFAKYQKKAAILLKGFAKKKDGAQAAAASTEANKNGAQATVDTAIDNGKKTAGVPNGAPANQPSLIEKYKTAFASDQFIVTK